MNRASLILPFTLLALFHAATSSTCDDNILPSPFNSPLSPTTGTHSEITILQFLLGRYDPHLCSSKQMADGEYDAATEACVRSFQQHVSLNTSGVFGRQEAEAMFAGPWSEDGYTDDGRTAASQGYFYKILIPVHRNRSIETTATILDKDNNVLFQFVAREKGHIVDGCGRTIPERWPNFNNTGDGLNTYSSGGATPTGLIEIDPNTKEGNESEFGPYPITRFVRGLKGNAQFLMPLHRNGILLHTGEWSNFSNWLPPMKMPNSAGCVHTWPKNVAAIWDAVVKLGLDVRNNTDGALPYPYKPQGLASVFLVD